MTHAGSHACHILHSIPEKVNWRCPHSCYTNYHANDRSLIRRREIEGARERERETGVEREKVKDRNEENSEWAVDVDDSCLWYAWLLWVRAWQTGSEISGLAKARASVLILPAGSHSLACFRGNTEDSQADKVKRRRNLNDMLVCIRESTNPVCGGLRLSSLLILRF